MGLCVRADVSVLHLLASSSESPLGINMAPQKKVFCPSCKRLMRTCCSLTSENGEADHLYVLFSDAFPDKVKIGRSKNVEERCCQLQEGMPFYINIACVFWGQGDEESRIHASLEALLVRDCPGREWFELPVDRAVAAVSRMLFAWAPKALPS